MTTAAVLAASEELADLAHRYERAFFDLQCGVPMADNPIQAPALLTRVDRIRETVTALEKEKTQLFADLTAYFAAPPTDFPAVQHALLAAAVQKAQPNVSLPRQVLGQVTQMTARLPWRTDTDTPQEVITQLAKAIGLALPTQLRSLAALLGSSTLSAASADYTARSAAYPVDTLIRDRAFVFMAIAAEYQSANYAALTPEQFWQWQLWRLRRVYGVPITVYNARAMVADAAETGLTADAVVFYPPAAPPEAYFLFRGTENVKRAEVPTHLTDTLAHPLAAMDASLIEGYRDWRYNVQAVLLGEDTELSQIDAARQFVTAVRSQLPADTRAYGIGHSLGGHLVQSLQLIDRPFRAGYTLNPAPVQLKQIHQIAPDRFSPAVWAALQAATTRGIANTTDQRLLAQTVQDPALAITNEGFAQDITRLFYNLAGNVYVGTYHTAQRPGLQYPFITQVTDYLSPAELQFATATLGDFFKKTASDQTTSLSWQIVNYMRAWGETPHLPPSKGTKYAQDYVRYLEATGWLSEEPVISARALPRWLTSRLSAGRLRTFRRIRFDMLGLAVYFHIIDGAQFFFLD
ncbi:DUF6792 domain-containing protein [Schleiferilactobacillus shenzhenensis]|uniref:DUF6792 domain-containing protein n=1 Tax=Schleiferilactobacillus shenzhenensis LY-73 TaxID=1231336 RepID=U4TQB4_9LACO|nr:DUF6792 domain-containing protein [Schleiferilactobacillus shenzhenensis]ERL65640.1 hypothetical protein L248_2326 [Schleiferilactobacillus shenzhenensis LY-73]